MSSTWQSADSHGPGRRAERVHVELTTTGQTERKLEMEWAFKTPMQTPSDTLPTQGQTYSTKAMPPNLSQRASPTGNQVFKNMGLF